MRQALRPRPPARWPRLAWVAVVASLLAACDGAEGGGSPNVVAGGSAPLPAPTSTSYTVVITDVDSKPLPGASVRIQSGTEARQGTADNKGSVTLTEVPVGNATLVASAAGFESVTFANFPINPTLPRTTIALTAEGAWALGRPVVLASRVTDRAADGSRLTIAADIAVVDQNSEPLLTLTAADFGSVEFDCGWMGPRGCASDADGRTTSGNNGQVRSDGAVLSAALQPAVARRRYVAGILLEISDRVQWDWDQRIAALTRYLATKDTQNLLGIATVRGTGDGAQLSMLGHYSSDGRNYEQALNQLPPPTGGKPSLLASLEEMIRRTATARDQMSPGAEAALLVVAQQFEITVADTERVSALARSRGVRISVLDTYNDGLSEIVARTGGFTGVLDDRRQFPMLLGALDTLLGGAMPFYRVEFRLQGEADTFVAGGNLHYAVQLKVPATIPHWSTFIPFDVAIP